MHRRRKIAYVILVGYVFAYGLLRAGHVIVHEGAYDDNGVKKFYAHRLEIEASISVLFPFGSPAVEAVFFPVMVSESLFWHCIKPT